MNEAARKAVEDALAAAKVRVTNGEQEIGALERACEETKAAKEADEQVIVELTAELATEETSPETEES